MKKLYLITGAAGHLGSALCAELHEREARMRALALPGEDVSFLRRMGAPREREESNTITVHDLSVNQDLRSVTLKGKEVNLTVKEFKLLRLLIERAGETLTREEIFKSVWGEDFMGETRALDMHIAQIRDKIKAAGGENMIVTVRGVGYRVD